MSSLVSIALATYNGDRYVAEFLESLISQTLSPYEVVVSDDASTDETLTIIKRFSNRLPIRILDVNNVSLGVTGNFSKAIAACQGDYIALADQDDVWLPTKLESLVRRIKSIESLDQGLPILAFSDAEIVNENLESAGKSFSQLTGKATTKFRITDFLISNHILGCTMLLNRALVQKALPVPAQACMHDWWLSMVAATFGQITYLPENLVKYRQHSSNSVGAARPPHALVKAYQWLFSPRKFELTSNRQKYASKLIANANSFISSFGDELPPHTSSSVSDFLRKSNEYCYRVRFLLFNKTGQPFVRSWLLMSHIKK